MQELDETKGLTVQIDPTIDLTENNVPLVGHSHFVSPISVAKLLPLIPQTTWDSSGKSAY